MTATAPSPRGLLYAVATGQERLSQGEGTVKRDDPEGLSVFGMVSRDSREIPENRHFREGGRLARLKGKPWLGCSTAVFRVNSLTPSGTWTLKTHTGRFGCERILKGFHIR